jgi:hypothetical protein
MAMEKTNGIFFIPWFRVKLQAVGCKPEIAFGHAVGRLRVSSRKFGGWAHSTTPRSFLGVAEKRAGVLDDARPPPLFVLATASQLQIGFVPGNIARTQAG